ncbi:hypothetical protein V1522DRAFT_267726, partial [Lipomyces starkeyi]
RSKSLFDYRIRFLPFLLKTGSTCNKYIKCLREFNESTLLVSSCTPQISLALGIYYELSDLLQDAAECKEEFSELYTDIAAAVAAGFAEYQKYYTFMDASDTYYAAVMLDPRVKAGLLQKEPGEDGEFIVNAIKERLHREYPSQLEPKPAHNALERESNLEARMLQRLQPKIDRNPISIGTLK